MHSQNERYLSLVYSTARRFLIRIGSARNSTLAINELVINHRFYLALDYVSVCD